MPAALSPAFLFDFAWAVYSFLLSLYRDELMTISYKVVAPVQTEAQTIRNHLKILDSHLGGNEETWSKHRKRHLFRNRLRTDFLRSYQLRSEWYTKEPLVQVDTQPKYHNWGKKARIIANDNIVPRLAIDQP